MYDYLRNAALDANNYFNSLNGLPKPVSHRNQFGVGAAWVVRDRSAGAQSEETPTFATRGHLMHTTTRRPVRVVVPASPPVDTGAGAPAPALHRRPNRVGPRWARSRVRSFRRSAISRSSELPDVPVPELPPPVPSSVNGAPPISAR